MKLNAFFEDREAVSPVIGVILMVAITVILAAVIGTFVLGLGDQVGDTAPNANWGTDNVEDYDGEDEFNATIFTHEGGDQVDPDTLSVTGDFKDTANGNVSEEGDVTLDNPLTAGDEIVVDVENEDGSVNLVWTSGDRSSILATSEFDFSG